MLAGDSLSVFLFLAGAGIAAVIGALTAPPGWRTRTLWWTAALFALAAGCWIIAPAASPMIQAIVRIMAAVVQSGILILIGTVLIVALMVGGRSAAEPPTSVGPAKKALPDFASSRAINWKPDISLTEAAMYLGTSSKWAMFRSLNMGSVKSELQGALISGKLSAWGKVHPGDADEYIIRRDAWEYAELNVDTSYVFLTGFGCAVHEVRLSKDELESAFPPANTSA
jgi:hypothetical protein